MSRNEGIERAGEVRRIRREHVKRQPQVARFRCAAARKHDQHQVSAVEVHHLKADDLGHIRAGSDRDGSVVCHAAREPGRLGEDLVELVLLATQSFGHQLGLGFGLFVFTRQAVYIKAVAEFARYSARRGVRLFEIAERLEVCHFVADGRRRAVRHHILRDVLGTDGFATLDIGLHDRTQDLRFSFGQIVFHLASLLFLF